MDADTLAGYLTLAAEATARAEQATPGPWDQPDRAWCDLGEVWPAARQSTHDEMAIAYDITRPADAAFIAATRTDIPALASAVDALAAEVQSITEQRDHARAWALFHANAACYFAAESAGLEGTIKRSVTPDIPRNAEDGWGI